MGATPLTVLSQSSGGSREGSGGSVDPRLAPVLQTIFHQCVILYTCSQSYSDGSIRVSLATSIRYDTLMKHCFKDWSQSSLTPFKYPMKINDLVSLQLVFRWCPDNGPDCMLTRNGLRYRAQVAKHMRSTLSAGCVFFFAHIIDSANSCHSCVIGSISKFCCAKSKLV